MKAGVESPVNKTTGMQERAQVKGSHQIKNENVDLQG